MRGDLAEIAVYVSFVLDLSVVVWTRDGTGAERVEAANRDVSATCRGIVARASGDQAHWELPYAPHARSLVSATVAAVAIERTGNLAVEVAQRGARAGTPPEAGRDILAVLADAGHWAADALGAAAAAMDTQDPAKALRATDLGDGAATSLAAVQDAVWGLPAADRRWASQALLASRCLERAAANASELAQRVIWVEFGSRLDAAA